MVRPILVVKVGTSTLLGASERPKDTFDYIAESIGELRSQYDIVLVTSGAIGFGVTQLKLDIRPGSTAELQALSMVGQVGLLKRWRDAFGDVSIGQVLVTRRDLEASDTNHSFRDSVRALWKYGALPIVNENDAVSSEEITFGDNDQLAAEIAVVLGAEQLIFLTDQDGIMEDFGGPSERRLEIASIEQAQQHIIHHKSNVGKGGGSSKLIAAQRALGAGTQVVITHAARPRAIESALTGQSGTKLVQ